MAPNTTKGERKKQPQEHIHAVLHLVHIVGHPVNEGGGADGVDFPVGQGVDMGEQIAAHGHAGADGGFSGKILGSQEKPKPTTPNTMSRAPIFHR